MSVTAWLTTAIALPLLFGIDVASRTGNDSTRRAVLRTLVPVGAAALFATSSYAVVGAEGSAQFVTAWTVAALSVVENAFVLVLLTAATAPSGGWVLAVLLVAVVARGVLSISGGIAAAPGSWLIAGACGLVLWSGWRVFARTEHADPTPRPLRTPMLFLFSCGAILVFALSSLPPVAAEVAGAGPLLVGNLFAVLLLLPVFDLVHRLLYRARWSPIGLAVISAFIAVKLGSVAVLAPRFEMTPDLIVLSAGMIVLAMAGAGCTRSTPGRVTARATRDPG